MSTSWTQKPVTILGLSKSGMATARYLASRGAICFVSETVPATPANKDSRDELQALGVEIEMGGHSAKCFNHSDLVVVSPGIPPSSQILKELSLSGKTIISEVELAYRETQVPFVAVTGTNGKTTTTTLISEILQAAGKISPACGNIGTPIISLVDAPADYFVAELSSFQLTFSPTLRAQVALFMNFRPDHLDWHGSQEAYKRAKFSLFEHQQPTDWSVLNADDPVCVELGTLISSKALWFSRTPASVADYPNAVTLQSEGTIVIRTDGGTWEPLFSIHDMKLVGRHNQENVLAAAAATWLLGIDAATIASAVAQFEGVEHRLEPVGVFNNIAYYNDSKATNPDASLSALEAFSPRRVVLIAGGRDKKTDLQEFVASVAKNAHHVVLLGEATERFAQALQTGGYTQISKAQTLDEAVQKATSVASADTPVLFSPACASFDMFQNFEARGRAFKQAVHQLLAVSSPS